jgi:hypothetical protein
LKVVLEILEQRFVHVQFGVRQVHNRTGLTAGPRIANVGKPIIGAEPDGLFLVAVAIPVQDSVRASDVRAERFRDLRGDNAEFLEN